MRLVFRADASRQIGAGHVMRVTAIAEEAIERGHECHFVGNIIDLAWVEKHVQNLGFKSFIREIDVIDSDFQNSVLILDSYTIEPGSPFICPDNWKLTVCVIDQFTPNYSADVFVNPTMTGKRAVSEGLMLEGPNYALMRKGIEKKTDKAVFEYPPKILIVGGGSDPYGFVEVILQQLSVSGLDPKTLVFSDENLESYKGMNVSQFAIGEELDEIANSVDLAITTASTTSLEFIAREIPTLVGCAVDNQESLYKELIEAGYVVPIGTRNFRGAWQLDFETLKRAIEDPKIRLNLWHRIKGVIDLKAASRVVDHIEITISRSI